MNSADDSSRRAQVAAFDARIERTRAAVEAAEAAAEKLAAVARELARGFAQVAAAEDADEADKINAETAKMIIGIAEREAETLPADEAAERLQAIAAAQTLDEAAEQTEKLFDWMGQRMRAAWLGAHDRLIALERGKLIHDDGGDGIYRC